MNSSKSRHFAEQVLRFRARFVQSVGASLGKVMSRHALETAVFEEA
jgi:hypothetical protein